MLLGLLNGLWVKLELDVDFIMVADVWLCTLLPDVLVDFYVAVLLGAVVHEDMLERVWEVTCGQPDTAWGSGPWREGIGSASLAYSARGSGLSSVLLLLLWLSWLLHGFAHVNLEVAGLASSTLAWRGGAVGLHHRLGRVPPPPVQEVLFALGDLVVSESGQVIDHRVLADGRLDLDEGMLSWRLLLPALSLLLFLAALITALSSMLVLGHALVALTPRLGWAGEGTGTLLCNPGT